MLVMSCTACSTGESANAGLVSTRRIASFSGWVEYKPVATC